MMHYVTLHCSMLHYITLHYIHCMALYTVHCSAMHSILYITLRFITSHCIHCMKVHCITWIPAYVHIHILVIHTEYIPHSGPTLTYISHAFNSPLRFSKTRTRNSYGSRYNAISFRKPVHTRAIGSCAAFLITSEPQIGLATGYD